MIDPIKNQLFTESTVVEPFIFEVSKVSGIANLKYNKILEPTNGAGNLSRELKKFGMEVVTNELDLQYHADTHIDVFSPYFLEEYDDVDIVFGNPPFLTYLPAYDKNGERKVNKKGELMFKRDKHAVDFIHRFMKLSSVHTVTMLLRLSILEPTKNRIDLLARSMFFRARQFSLAEVAITYRMSFTANGKKDSQTTCFCTWKTDRDPKEPTELLFLDKFK